MPLIVRDQDITQGHCWSETPLQAGANEAVFVNGRLAIIMGDITIEHDITCLAHTTNPLPNHPIEPAVGSPTVFIGGAPVIRDGDPMKCGDVADTQGGNVFADGGGNIAELFPGGIPAGQSPGETVSYVVAGPDALIASWPPITIDGFTTSSVGPNGGVVKNFANWNNLALQPKAANLFKIRLTEEDIGRSEGQRTFISTQGIGAPNLPAVAPSIFRAPLDPFVTFEVTQGQEAFTIDNAGTLTLVSGFVPPRDSNNNTGFVDSIEIKVNMIYGNQGVLFKEFTIDVDIFLSLNNP